MKYLYRAAFSLEVKRIFTKKMFILIVSCFILSIVMWIIEYRESEKDFLYREVVQQYVGISNQEKINDIKNKVTYYSKILDEHTLIAEQYAKGEIREEEFQKFITDYKDAKIYLKSYQMIRENAIRFEKQKKTSYFLYDIKWKKIFENDVQWIFIFMMLSLTIPYLYMDRETKYYSMGKTYSKYSKIEWYRVLFVSCIITALQIVWLGTELCIIILRGSISNIDFTACSLEKFKELPENITLGTCLLMREIFMILKRSMDVFAVYFLSRKVNYITTAIVMLVYLLISDAFIL